jgi:opacity protein-like surface antigen
MSIRALTLGLMTVSAIALAAPASAADLGRRMPVKAPPVVAPPPFTWTGCYVGGYVGGAWAAADDAVFTDLGNANWADRCLFLLQCEPPDSVLAGG